MVPPARQRGVAMLLIALGLAMALAALLIARLSLAGSAAERQRATERALALAREALIAYAAERPIDARVGPGYLPCPDLDDDGWAEAICGSLDGALGQAGRLGRLPWKTLGLSDVRDGSGERLWYAVSTRHKGLLHCAASAACIDMSPDAAIGTITVRDPSGSPIQDGTLADLHRLEASGAAAVVLAPGPAIERPGPDGRPAALQVRACGPGQCDASLRCLTDPPSATAKCDARNYLDLAPAERGGEDNARFTDRSDPAARSANSDGFIQGPVRRADGATAVNDRLAAITYADLMPRVMRRVALEVGHCLAAYAAANGGRLAWPAPACRQAGAGSLAWADAPGVRFGRIADTPFEATRASSGGRMAILWPETSTCAIALSGRTASQVAKSWWSAWRPFVFVALAPSHVPRASSEPPACSEATPCLEVESGGIRVANGKHFAVLVAGPPIGIPGRPQTHGAEALGDARQWLEPPNAALEGANPDPAAADCAPRGPIEACEPAGCTRIAIGLRGRWNNDVALAFP